MKTTIIITARVIDENGNEGSAEIKLHGKRSNIDSPAKNVGTHQLVSSALADYIANLPAPSR